MYLLPFLISTLLVSCHAYILPDAYILPGLENSKAWNQLSHMYETDHVLPKLRQYEELLSQYRKYLINNIYENNDICSLFEYLTDNNNSNNNIWVSNDVIDGDDNKKEPGKNIVLVKKRSASESNEEEIPIEQPFHELNRHMTAVDTYLEIANTIRDQLFYLELLRKLEKSCDAYHEYYKRDGPLIVGKKVKFHSWGGKRTNRMIKEPIKDPVNTRSYPPFHSWGG